ncbi:hypothetical protein P8C59_000474 [Phyllachora maydis]|uniref:Uncharacterized protein n=1 Tax=Phyllachora maydis TaxID=1825666 RepID=A0AAD9HW58_9PEZI|nr:hypothetical protein P8C59_000474 [Phyllachora maydis]
MERSRASAFSMEGRRLLRPRRWTPNYPQTFSNRAFDLDTGPSTLDNAATGSQDWMAHGAGRSRGLRSAGLADLYLPRRTSAGVLGGDAARRRDARVTRVTAILSRRRALADRSEALSLCALAARQAAHFCALFASPGRPRSKRPQYLWTTGYVHSAGGTWALVMSRLL